MANKKNPKGAGRKPLPDSERKTMLTLFFKQGVIDEHGGQEKMKDKIYTVIESGKLKK